MHMSLYWQLTQAQEHNKSCFMNMMVHIHVVDETVFSSFTVIYDHGV